MPRSLPAALALALVVLCSQAAGADKPRIVSLIPSLTEDLFAIGAGAQIVGASAFTDYPPSAAALPVVATFSSVDTEKVIALHPDLIVGIDAQAGVVRDLRRAGFAPHLLPDDTYADIFSDLATLGRLSGHEPEAAALATRLRARTAEYWT